RVISLATPADNSVKPFTVSANKPSQSSIAPAALTTKEPSTLVDANEISFLSVTLTAPVVANTTLEKSLSFEVSSMNWEPALNVASPPTTIFPTPLIPPERSEERRVGKECSYGST